VKVGDLVKVRLPNDRPHITSNRVLLTKSVQGILVHNWGDGNHSVVLDNGVRIMTSYANLEVISESR